MDRTELKDKLSFFKAKCLEGGKPLEDICLEEAFPGDNSTSYILQVKAPWIEQLSCSESLDFLFDILWETTEEDTRRYIFSIQLLDNNDEFHCESETNEHRNVGILP